MIEFQLDEVGYPKKVYNTAFFCVRCGEVWARLTRHEHNPWYAHNRTCVACADPVWPTEFVGSLADPYEEWYDHHGLADAPLEALVYEMELLARVDNATEQSYTNSTSLIYRGPLSMDLTTRIAELRSKVLNKTVTKEELREACVALRAERMSASERRDAKKAATAKPDGAALLAKLASLGQKQ